MVGGQRAALFGQIRVLTDKHDALAAATGQSFNLFEILDRETDEVKTHSAILAELLDPNGSHEQGPVFARLFAKRFRIPTDGIKSAQVDTEVTVDTGSRVDILLEWDDICVVVENKIHAGDRCRQLERYHCYASQSAAYFKVIYLTLHGDDPSDASLGNLDQRARDEIARFSYGVDVLKWLDDCIKEVARIPQLREILAHYQALLRKLTGRSTGELVMGLKKLLTQKQGGKHNFELVPKIAEAMTALSVETEWKYWQMLKRRLLRAKNRRAWRLVIHDTAGSASSKEVSEEAVRHAHGSGNKHKWKYGWTFRVESKADRRRYGTDGGGEVLLRVEVDDYGWVFYGFVAVRNAPDGHQRLSREDDPRLFESWGNRLSQLEEGWHTDSDSWMAWAYPAEDVPLQKDDGWLAPKAISGFRKRKKAVRPLINDIQGTIDAIEQAGE